MLATPAANPAGAATIRPASGDSTHASVIAQKPQHIWQTASFGLLVVIVLAVLVLAALALPRYPPARADDSAMALREPEVHVQLGQPSADASSVAPPARSVATPVRVAPVADASPISQTKAQRRTRQEADKASDETAVRKSPGESRPSTATVLPVALGAGAGETASVVAPAAPTSTSPAASPARAGAASPTPVTITGCLEISVDDDRFRLTDTEGGNVPKARSWRSGFLRKRSTPVELVDLADPATARKYVGQRVVATGLVENREMRVRSLQMAGAACD